jgi:hypothetical protein
LGQGFFTFAELCPTLCKNGFPFREKLSLFLPFCVPLIPEETESPDVVLDLG